MNLVFVVLYALISASISEAKWCYRNITTTREVTKFKTKIIYVTSGWYTTTKIGSYKEVESFPITKQSRVCCEGYTLDDVSQRCIPTCSDGCPKMAECTEPNTCKCHPGYHLENNLCRLDCGNCENGHCTDLGSCECNPKYVRVDDLCQPICRNKCSNGICAAPDKCKCNPGYQENLETSRCEPICTKTCGGNAYCSAPDVCVCKYGFFGNAYDVCQPWCKAECKNGECVGPNTCACHQGFAKIDGLCMPDCQSGCMFGDCLDEGFCRCWPDYVYNSTTRSCQEKLDVEYTTAAPSTRAITTQTSQGQMLNCIKGYVKADPSCVCENCKVGECVEEHLCPRFARIQSIVTTESITSESFISISSTSESFTNEQSTTDSSTSVWATEETNACKDECVNGVCLEDYYCECLSGYVKSVNLTKCVPKCENECVNSFCTAPNECTCLEGYTKQSSPLPHHICLPMCDGVHGEAGCINGKCAAVNKCECSEGFVPKPGNRFECISAMKRVEDKSQRSWLLYFVLVILGLLILLTSVLILYALRNIKQDSYNVDKVEKRRGTVRHINNDYASCDV